VSFVEGGGQEAAVVALGVAAFFVVVACWAGLGVVYLFDYDIDVSNWFWGEIGKVSRGT
jgi:hypothetical protein